MIRPLWQAPACQTLPACQSDSGEAESMHAATECNHCYTYLMLQAGQRLSGMPGAQRRLPPQAQMLLPTRLQLQRLRRAHSCTDAEVGGEITDPAAAELLLMMRRMLLLLRCYCCQHRSATGSPLYAAADAQAMRKHICEHGELGICPHAGAPAILLAVAAGQQGCCWKNASPPS